MTATKVKTWPTFEEADQVVAKLSKAYAAVDGFMVRCHGLLPVDDSPWERPHDTPIPTAEDVAALAWLAMNVRLHVRGDGDAEQMLRWSEECDQLLASASSFEAGRRGQRR